MRPEKPHIKLTPNTGVIAKKLGAPPTPNKPDYMRNDNVTNTR